jgi:hypothetical protein
VHFDVLAKRLKQTAHALCMTLLDAPDAPLHEPYGHASAQCHAHRAPTRAKALASELARDES